MEQHAHSRDRNLGQWIDKDDRIYVAAYSSVASLHVVFQGYFRKLNGDIIQFSQSVAPTSDRAVSSATVTVGEGFLISLVAFLASGNANRGQCYVRARVQRSTGTPQVILANLIGGYVTDEYQPSFPYGKIESSLDGAGFVSFKEGTDPAAQTETDDTVPTGARWRVMFYGFEFTADANTGDRRVALLVGEALNAGIWLPSNATQTANQVWYYSWVAGAANYVNTDLKTAVSPLPVPCLLRAGSHLSTATVNLKAGDNIALVRIQVEEWIEA